MATATPTASHRRSRFIELCSRPSSPSLDVSCAATDAGTDTTACARLSTSPSTTADNSSTTTTLTTPSTTSISISIPTSKPTITTPTRPHPIHRSSHPAFDVTLEQVLADHEAWERKRDKRASTASWGSFGGMFALEGASASKSGSRTQSRSGNRRTMGKGLVSEVSMAGTKEPPAPTAEVLAAGGATTTTQPRRPPIYHSTSTSTSNPKPAQSYQRASIRTVSTATNQSSQTTSSMASAASSRTTVSSAATSFSSGQPSRRSSLSAAFGLGKGRGLGGSLRRTGTGVWRGRTQERDIVVENVAMDEMKGKEEVLPVMVTGRVRPRSSMAALARLGEERHAEPTPATGTAKNDAVPADDEEPQAVSTTEANVALALAQLTQTSPSPLYPKQSNTQGKEKKLQPTPQLPTQTSTLALLPISKAMPNADSQAKMQAKAKTRASKRWSRILPWK